MLAGSQHESPLSRFPTLLKQWYIRSNPGANRLRLVAHCASGLTHMHYIRVVHEDIRPMSRSTNASNRMNQLPLFCQHNIAINPEHSAAITNFRFATAMNNPRLAIRDVGNHWRYMAVELLDADRNLNGSSAATDVWGFGMSALEVCRFK